jgi:hypothetical protein
MRMRTNRMGPVVAPTRMLAVVAVALVKLTPVLLAKNVSTRQDCWPPP